MTSLTEANISIVGLGLMGGSLAAALQGKCASITGIDMDRSAIAYAFEQGWIQHGYHELEEGIRQANIIILAVPVRSILVLLDQVSVIVEQKCILMDLGSTKKQITDRMASLPGCIQPIGGHPMCGREVSGIQAADPSLFIGNKFLLTPLEQTTDETLSMCLQIINAIGALPLIIDAGEHDRLVAAASHIPYIAAASLLGTAYAIAREDRRMWDVASSGFRDTTRLASSDVTMMLDIILTNREPILEVLDIYRHELDMITSWIKNADEQSLREYMIKTRSTRKEWAK